LISNLYIDADVIASPKVQAFQNKLSVPFTIFNDISEVYSIIEASSDPVSQGKKNLILTRNKGAFIKKCPGTSEYTCCDYQILHIGSFCHMDCSYCILQAYFHPPVLQYFVNDEDLFKELDQTFSKNQISRIGTGEFTDSLIWEIWTEQAKPLIECFATQKKAILELKTKTTAVHSLENLDHNKKTIVSWSLNTECIIKSDERGTSSLDARLKAAALCESWGYKLAFHFDPIVIYENCIPEYMAVIEKLFNHIKSDSIVYISLGSFRYIPSLKKIIQNRFPDSGIIYGEFIIGLDNKMRYFKPLRIKTYKAIIEKIRMMAPDVFVYFCMEDDEVWIKSMGFSPEQFGGLGKMLDERVRNYCNLKL